MVNNKANSLTETNSSKTVNVKAKQSLMNIEIGQSYTDNLGQVYAIAYIHRLKTAEIYESQIMENSARICNYLEQALTCDNSWKIYALHSAAALINIKNEELISQLAIISPDTKAGLELGYDPAQLKQRLAELAKDIVFMLDIEGDVDGKVTAIIREILTNNGFTISPSEGIALSVKLTFEDVELNQPQKFVRYTLAMNMYDPDGKIILTLTDNSREGHLNQAEAKARAIRTLQAKIKKELPARLFRYFDGMVIANK
jgi:hypothetical protein